MILQQLAQDAECIVGDLPPSMYVRRPVKWILDLDGDGSIRGAIRTSGGQGKRDTGAERLVPFVVRTSGIRPILLADSPAYSLGLAPDDRHAPRKHEQYRQLVERCADATGHPAVRAVARFLDAWNQDAPRLDRLPAEMSGLSDADLLTFRVEGVIPVDEPPVQKFWQKECQARDLSGALPGQCLLCGEKKPIPSSLPVLIKRVPGGQTAGVAPSSVNATAFESYGLAGGRTAAVCQECGERFGKALNALLAQDDSHLAVGPLVYVFWTREKVGFSPVSFLRKPDPEAVKQLLSAFRSGPRALAIDDLAFFAVALSASGGRAVIRDWLETTLGHVKVNLVRWFDILRQVDAYGQPGQPLGVFPVAAALYRDATKDMAPQVPRALVRAALHGSPLPPDLLVQAINRCRVEQQVTYPRAALIKAALVSGKPGKEAYMSALEPNETRPAYLCGRLLAVLEEIQREAIPGINTTLVDRFYGTASTAPATVFGHLLSGAQAHLSKLRRTRGSAHYALQERLEAVMRPLSAFPRTLALQDQALFSLGYYHQRADDRAAMQARRAAKAEAAEADTNGGNKQ
ncbi:MAG: type I-C CRISPR-associated protein Cas8c/Csd1 [Armatimonadetes bacterium]|nr:type I-C CRISPR-associated protein Cas8c/Csd1 [Armatimonadota bacterium]